MLRVTSLYLILKGRTIFNDVAFELHENQIFQVTGGNGSGKTLLLKSIIGVVEISGGEIHNAFHSCGFLIEYPAFYLNMTVKQNLFISSQYLSSKYHIENLYDIFELGPLLNQKAGLLSLGQKQRLGLAKAFMGEPDLVVLDEPFSNLDSAYKEKLSQFLSQYVKRGRHAILFTSHEYSPTFQADGRIQL